MLSDIVIVKYLTGGLSKNIYLYFYTEIKITEPAKYIYLEDQKVDDISNVLNNFNTLPDLIKLLAILVYVSMGDDSLEFSFKLTNGKINHEIIVRGNKKKVGEQKMSINKMEKDSFELDSNVVFPYFFKIKKYKKLIDKVLSKGVHKRYKKLIDERTNYDFVFDYHSTYTLGGVQFDKSLYETGIFTGRQAIKINIYSIYSNEFKTTDWFEQLYHLQLLDQQYYEAEKNLATVSPFRHKKPRRRGSKSVKRLRKLGSKSKSRKLSPKTCRR